MCLQPPEDRLGVVVTGRRAGQQLVHPPPHTHSLVMTFRVAQTTHSPLGRATQLVFCQQCVSRSRQQCPRAEITGNASLSGGGGETQRKGEGARRAAHDSPTVTSGNPTYPSGVRLRKTETVESVWRNE